MTRILLVDDDEQIRFAMSEILKGRGFDVVVADNGYTAQEAMQTQKFDVVLLDIFMPERDGFETIADIRVHHPDMKIIAMSGYQKDEFEALRYAQTLGADDILSKPFSADTMIETLNKLNAD